MAASGVSRAEFTLAAANDVHVFVFDTGPQDNVGGVSLRLTAVPEPATLLVFGAALVGLCATLSGARQAYRVIASSSLAAAWVTWT